VTSAVDTHWRDWGSTRTFGLGSSAWPTDVDLSCNAESPDGGQDWCSREKGHPGRHIAAHGRPRFQVISAWPGTHEPRKEDLT